MLAFLDTIPFGTSRLRRLLFWLLAVFAVYVLIGFFVVPPALEALITGQCRAVLGRKGTVGHVAFNPLTLRLTVDKVAVAKLKGEGDLFFVEQLDATAGLATLWKFAPVVSSLKLVSPRLDITFFGNGRYSISDLIGVRETGKEPPSADEPASVFPFALYGFEMSNATIVFDDRPHEKKHVISEFDLVVPFTSSFLDRRKEYTQPKFSAVVNGDPVQLTGRTLPFDNTLRTEFKLGAVEVDLAQYWGYLPLKTGLALEGGSVSADISLLFERPDAQRMNLFLGGSGQLTGLKMKDRVEGSVLSLKRLAFRMDRYSLGDNHLDLDEVTVDDPACTLIRRPDGSLNWAGYFQAEEGEDNATPASGGAFTMDLHRIAVTGGRVRWEDRAVPGGFSRVIENMNAEAENVSTRDGARCTFSASLGKGETLALKGSATILPSPESSATVTVSRLNLPAFKPYYADAVPLELVGGTAGFSGTVSFDARKGDRVFGLKNGTLTLDDLALTMTGGAYRGGTATLERATVGATADATLTPQGGLDVRMTGGSIALSKLALRTSGRAHKGLSLTLDAAGAKAGGDLALRPGTEDVRIALTGGALTLDGLALRGTADGGPEMALKVDRGAAAFDAATTLGSGAEPVLTVTGGSLDLAGMDLRKTNSRHPNLAWETLAVSGVDLDLAARRAALGEIRLDAPEVRVVRLKSGRLDLLTLLGDDTEDDEAQGPDWSTRIGKLRITDGEVEYVDLSQGKPMDLGFDGIAASLDGLGSAPGAMVPFSLSGNWTSGRGRIEVEGRAGLDPIKAEGSLRLLDLSLQPVEDFLAGHTEMLFGGGSGGADLAFSYAEGDPPQVAVSGSAELNGVQLRENWSDAEILGFDKLQVQGLKLKGEPYRMDVAAVQLQGPRITVDVDAAGHSNLRRALRLPQPAPEAVGQDGADAPAANRKKAPAEKKAAPPPPSATEADADPPAPFTIGRIALSRGVLHYRDASVQPTYDATVSGMRMALMGLSRSPDARPKLDFKAHLGPTPIHVIGTLNPLVSPPYSDLAVSVSGLDMTQLTPYALKNLAYPIKKGTLYADVKFRTKDMDVSADNKFFIEQLELGPKDKRPGAPNVPVQAGLALLQDSSGNLTLDLPVRGRLDDPNLRIGALVFKAVVNIMFKALTSPLSLIGSIFGGKDAANMDFVVFDPGRSRLTKTARGKLDTVAKALASRPKLRLDVEGLIDPVTDKSGLIRVLFDRKIQQQKYDDMTRQERAGLTVDQIRVQPSEYEEYLFDAYRDEDDPDDERPTSLFVVDRQPVDVMEKFILDRITVTDVDLAALAADRAKAVKDYIAGKDPALADRVRILDRRRGHEAKPGVPRHRADLEIK
ncbi:MAG: DUF748 domain-containing protein [Pseudodesulfovibrio sp.]